MKRETTQELEARITAANEKAVPLEDYRHVKSGVVYLVLFNSLSADDLSAQVQYRRRGQVGAVVFSRPIEDFLAKFVKVE